MQDEICFKQNCPGSSFHNENLENQPPSPRKLNMTAEMEDETPQEQKVLHNLTDFHPSSYLISCM